MQEICQKDIVRMQLGDFWKCWTMRCMEATVNESLSFECLN